MFYLSTRNNYQPVNSATAISLGMVPAGGLFVPETLPKWQISWQDTVKLSYKELALAILKLYLTDYNEETLKNIVDASYGDNFFHKDIAPLVKLKDNRYILELWHGPTAAFKDMALQIMPRLLTQAVAQTQPQQETVILVATSGDTGKAALEGFKNVPGIKIIVFYPAQGISPMQRLQMVTTDADNTFVVAVNGNFDHCQNGVKGIFADAQINDLLAKNNLKFSSANSINWGRLLPQIVYYFWAYSQLLQKEALKSGDAMDVAVPTGNFGNILAGYYAKCMGLPIKTLICASNENNVLADVLATGTYDKRRGFFKTTSPSMDILVSSNFERFLYAMTDGDGTLVTEAMQKLGKDGTYTVPTWVKENWQKIMAGGYANQAQVQQTIRDTFNETGYTLDPHTAVGVKVYEDFVAAKRANTPGVILSTASPFKFGKAVLKAQTGQEPKEDGPAQLNQLAKISGWPIHPCLNKLEGKPVLHNLTIEKEDMAKTVLNILKIN